MYLCIDLGGTKTAIATVNSSGEITNKHKIKTDHNYDVFIKNLANLIKQNVKEDIKLTCLAVPGLLDREAGVVKALGNLPWKDKPISADVEKLTGCKVIIENDTKLGGLGEARALDGKHSRVLYFTISTGIGAALVIDGNLSKDMQDMEIGKAPLYYKSEELAHWEKFASGRYLFETYGKKASELDDEKIWEVIGDHIAYGVGIACSVLQPEVIIFGGGIGQYADKFTSYISIYLKNNLHEIVRKPEIMIGPKYGEDSVLYGCYEYIKDYDK